MSAYFDSSIITKWYLPEPDSAEALRLRARFLPPSPLTHLHRVELTTAWHLKVFRKELTEPLVVLALRDLAADVHAGVWSAPAYDLEEVHRVAESLARDHASKLGVRTLDILHVAAALSIGADGFVTNDERQAKLARVVKLPVWRLHRGG